MNWLVCHIAGGSAFFTGAALNVLAAGLVVTRRRFRRLATMCSLVGLIAVAVSATPLPYWSYAVCALISMAFLICIQRTGTKPTHYRAVVILFALCWLIEAGFELPYHLALSLEPIGTTPIVIFGDSLTAGVGEEDEETWPQILARDGSFQIDDRSQMGATIGSTLEKVRSQPIPAGTVILEIGGNDILGATTAEDCAGDLDSLLKNVSGKARQTVMFELPLPPFYNEYGRVQRRLARKYGVKLIPKRYLMRVLAGDDATLDSIHLSRDGHRRMAALMEKLLQPEWNKAKGS